MGEGVRLARKSPWPLAAALALFFAAFRVVGVLGPPSLRWLLPLGFVLMSLVPWLVLDAEGRRRIGFARPANARIWLVAGVAGAVTALLVFALGLALFGDGADNWFVSVANSYRRIVD